MKVPPVIGEKWQIWAEDLRRYLGRVESQLSAKEASSSANENGVILWDRTNGYPVVSKSGVFRQIVLADGYAIFIQDASITAAAANTAYAIEFDTPSLASGITKSGTNPTRIVFSEGGLYRVSFTAQITSSSASTVELRFWPRVNGTNVAGSTMVASLHSNGSTSVICRDSIFQFAANDYLEAMWATDRTSGFLEAHAATAYAPASPSVTLSISRVQA